MLLNMQPISNKMYGKIELKWESDKENTFKVFVSKNNSEFVFIGETKNKYFKYISSIDDVNGTRYIFRVTTIEDNKTISLNSIEYTYIDIQEAPIITNNLPMYNKTNVQLEWEHNADNFTVELYSENKKISSQDTSEKKCLIDIADAPKGKELDIRLAAQGSDGIVGQFAVIPTPIFVNAIPLQPEVIGPKYTTNKIPRILLKANKSMDSQKMIMHVDLNGCNYNSKDNSKMFSKSILGDNDVTCFLPNKELNIGINTIKIKTFDGMEFSNEGTFNIEVSEQLTRKNVGDLITKNDFMDMINSINKSRTSYGMEAENITIASDDYVYRSTIKSIVMLCRRQVRTLNSMIKNSAFEIKEYFNVSGEEINSILLTENNNSIITENSLDYLIMNYVPTEYIIVDTYNQFVKYLNSI